MSREMINSGNPFIGLIPKEWTCQRIKTLIEGMTDGTHGTYERVSVGRPLLSAKNVFDDGLHIGDNESQISEEDYISIISNGYPHKGDVLLCCVGTIGRCTVYQEENPYAFQRSVIFLRPNSKILPKMLKYAMQCDTTLSQEVILVNQAAQPGLYQGSVKELSLPVPPVTEQRAIVSYLDSKCSAIDEAIEKHKKIIEKIEDYRKTLITYTVTKGLDSNKPMKSIGVDWIGEIPCDWDYLKLTWLLDNTHPYPIGDGDHGIIKTEDYQENGIPYIRVQNIGWGTPIKTDNIVYISEEMNDKIANSTLRPGDVLFAKTGATIGKTAFISDDMPIANTTSHIGKITLSPRYNSKYIFYVLSSYVGYKQFWDFASMKATRPELAISEIKTIKVTLPRARAEQDEIVSFLDRKTQKIDKLLDGKRATISKLEEYRKSIIYNAVTGKIDCRTEAAG